MKNFKRFSAVILSVAMICLTACNNSQTPVGDDVPETTPYSFHNPLPTPEMAGEPAPQVPEPEMLEQIKKSYEVNPDTIGWLSVPNTTVNDPVLVGKDNKFYLRKNVNKQYDWYGVYFADFEGKFGNRNQISKNTIIYGHSMDDDPEGLKFSQLKKFLDPKFATNNPYVYFSTSDDDMIWKVFAVFFNEAKKKTNDYYIENEPSQANFMNIISEANKRSQLIYDVDVNANDKILTLSTCTYKYGSRLDQRYVVMARLVRADEKLETTVKVEVNPSPKEPQFD